MRRAPAFWSRPRGAPGLAARALAPLAWVWEEATRRRLTGVGLRVDVPVICVGNLTLGGAGKTPTVAALAGMLSARGVAAHIISRGHGGSLAGPLQVDARRHSAAEVGDEPLLLAGFAPVWVGRDRAAAARAAVSAGAQAVVLDDGFQNPSPAKDLSIVVVDAGFGFGNGRVAPAGPLREPVSKGLARADLVLLLGDPEVRARALRDWPELGAGARIEGELRPLDTGMNWKGIPTFAFAGIGRPEKFFATLTALGAEVVGTRAFADHAAYDSRILARLARDARAAGAQLVTTEKDAVRLPPEFRRQVLMLPVRLAIAEPSPLETMLERLGLGAGR